MTDTCPNCSSVDMPASIRTDEYDRIGWVCGTRSLKGEVVGNPTPACTEIAALRRRLRITVAA